MKIRKFLNFVVDMVVSLLVLSVPASATYLVGKEAIEKARTTTNTSIMSTVKSWIPFLNSGGENVKTLTLYEKYQILINNGEFLIALSITGFVALMVLIVNVYIVRRNREVNG